MLELASWYSGVCAECSVYINSYDSECSLYTLYKNVCVCVCVCICILLPVVWLGFFESRGRCNGVPTPSPEEKFCHMDLMPTVQVSV